MGTIKHDGNYILSYITESTDYFSIKKIEIDALTLSVTEEYIDLDSIKNFINGNGKDIVYNYGDSWDDLTSDQIKEILSISSPYELHDFYTSSINTSFQGIHSGRLCVSNNGVVTGCAVPTSGSYNEDSNGNIELLLSYFFPSMVFIEFTTSNIFAIKIGYTKSTDSYSLAVISLNA